MFDQVVDAALRAAQAGARAAGLDPTGLRLVRAGENVILLLPTPRRSPGWS